MAQRSPHHGNATYKHLDYPSKTKQIAKRHAKTEHSGHQTQNPPLPPFNSNCVAESSVSLLHREAVPKQKTSKFCPEPSDQKYLTGQFSEHNTCQTFENKCSGLRDAALAKGFASSAQWDCVPAASSQGPIINDLDGLSQVHEDDAMENIYEEVVPKSGESSVDLSMSPASERAKFPSTPNRKSLVDEVMYEVERVQRQHAQVLQELNLEMENLIMPSVQSPPTSPIEGNNCNNSSSDSPTVSYYASSSIYPNLCNSPSLPTSRHSDRGPSINATRELPTLPLRSSSSRFSLKQNLVKISQTMTSTPVAKRKWLKLPSKHNAKDTNQDATYSDESIYEDIDQHMPESTTTMPTSVVSKDKKRGQFFKEFEFSSDKSDSEKNSTAVSLSSIKHKLRSVRQRMSKGKRKEEHWSTFSKLRETNPVAESEIVMKCPEPQEEEAPTEIKWHPHPPCLPPVPKGLSPEQGKRRLIISTLVQSENTYFVTLKRLLHDYKKPLEESTPPILTKSKIDTLFYRIPEIQQCHAMFRIALADCVQRWDKEEKIGDVFVASFSKSMVLDMYSDFINNFSMAMEEAKSESKRKSAFADFLKVKQITSPDRLSFFGLMVKPVQRFPQFILLLQDLLKHTPQGHSDRMNLQLALTQLENLTEMLNERKRESEQQHAAKELLQHINAKSALKSMLENNQSLLREDNMLLLKFDQDSQIVKSKERRLLLLNNLLVCVAVSFVPGPGLNCSERYALKWIVPLNEVEIQEELSPVLNRMIMSSHWGKEKAPKSDQIVEDDLQMLSQDMANLMHDFEVISRISALVATLKQPYQDLSLDITERHLQGIMQKIQTKDQEMQLVDSCCLQLQLPIRSKNTKDLVIFKTSGPKVTADWLIDIRLSQLALDVNNSPAWHISEAESVTAHKMPLFVQAVPLFQASYATEVRSTCYYICHPKQPNNKPHRYLWVCSSDGVNSHISIIGIHDTQVKPIITFEMNEVRISTMEAVPGPSSSRGEIGFKGWTVWMGTDSRRIIMFSGSDPDQHENLGYISAAAPILQLCYYRNRVFAALANGTIIVYKRISDNEWDLKDAPIITLGSEPVTSLLPRNGSMYCACGRKVWVLHYASGEITKSFVVQHEQQGNVYLLAQSGIGLWINLRNTATICLYHMETFRHLQDINIASNVNRILTQKYQATSTRCIFITSLLASRGLLWLGTNVGVVLTIPLPRLEGVPIISGRAAISYHMMTGPVTTLNALAPPQPYSKEEEEHHLKLSKQMSLPERGHCTKWNLPSRPSSLLFLNNSAEKHSPIHQASLATQKENNLSKNSSNEDYDIYGLYGDLMNISIYDETPDSMYEPLRRSEPDLLPNAIGTLDRRLQMKAGRPKSLDLTNLSNLSTSEQPSMYSSSEDNSSTKSCMSTSESSKSSFTIPISSLPSQKSKPSSTDIPKTMTVVMGGRGYIFQNLQTSSTNAGNASSTNDAHIVFWETRYF